MKLRLAKPPPHLGRPFNDLERLAYNPVERCDLGADRRPVPVHPPGRHLGPPITFPLLAEPFPLPSRPFRREGRREANVIVPPVGSAPRTLGRPIACAQAAAAEGTSRRLPPRPQGRRWSPISGAPGRLMRRAVGQMDELHVAPVYTTDRGQHRREKIPHRDPLVAVAPRRGSRARERFERRAATGRIPRRRDARGLVNEQRRELFDAGLSRLSRRRPDHDRCHAKARPNCCAAPNRPSERTSSAHSAQNRLPRIARRCRTVRGPGGLQASRPTVPGRLTNTRPETRHAPPQRLCHRGA